MCLWLRSASLLNESPRSCQGKDRKMNQINLLFSEPVFPPTSVSDVAALLSGSFLLEGILAILQRFMAQRSPQVVSIYLFGCATSYAGSSSPTRDQTWASALGAQSLSHWTTREIIIIFQYRAFEQSFEPGQPMFSWEIR